MYLLNAEIEIVWELPPTLTPTPLSNFDVLTTTTSGILTYVSSAIPVEDYVAPTSSVPGSLTYRFTPTKEGLWNIQLVRGVPEDYLVLDRTDVFVFDNETVVNPIKNTPLGVNSAIEVGNTSGLVTSEATRLNFIGTGFDIIAALGIVTVTLADAPDVPYRTASDLLSALTGQMNEDAFAASLKTRLNLIDGIEVGSVFAQVATVHDRVDILDASISDPITGLNAQASVISANAAWVAAVDGYITSQSSTIETWFTELDDNAALVQTQATSIDGLEAKYTVKVDVNGNVAGYGLASSLNEADGLTFDFTMVVDKFSIVPTTGGLGTKPFFHLTIPTTIDGTLVPAGTYMESAFIANGAITNLKIGNIIESADSGASWRIDKNGGITARSLTLLAASDGLPMLTSDGTGSIVDDIAAAALTGGTGAETFVDLLPDTPAGAGFFSSATHLGYYDSAVIGDEWRTYMGKNGDFYLSSASGDSLSWISATGALVIKGSIEASSFVTATSGKRIVINLSDSNEIRAYGSDGALAVAIGAKDGLSYAAGAFYGDDNNYGLYVRNVELTAAYFLCGAAADAVRAYSYGAGYPVRLQVESTTLGHIFFQDNLAYSRTPKAEGSLRKTSQGLQYDTAASETRLVTENYCVLYHTETAGTAAGNIAAVAWTVRKLNILIEDGYENSFCALTNTTTGTFTLAPGTYRVYARVPTFYTQGSSARLRNLTSSVTVLEGTSRYSGDSTGPADTYSEIIGVFTILNTYTFQLQSIVAKARNVDGLGRPSLTGNTERYTVIEIFKTG